MTTPREAQTWECFGDAFTFMLGTIFLVALVEHNSCFSEHWVALVSSQEFGYFQEKRACKNLDEMRSVWYAACVKA